MIYAKYSGDIIEEMSIVDIFTKLIFDADATLNETDVHVVALLQQIEQTLSDASLRDVSEYLRAMGVNEMIALVAQVKKQFDQQQSLIAKDQTQPTLRVHR